MDNRYHFHLDEASLCADCRMVSNSKRACHACASVNLMDLANVIDRETGISIEGSPNLTVVPQYTGPTRDDL